jgi:hypothetical protein
MFKRYLRYREDNHIDVNDPDMAAMLPNPLEDINIRQRMKDLKNFKSITLHLQARDITMAENRELFTNAVLDHPGANLGKWIGEYAEIVHSPSFENAVVKIQNGNESELTDYEKNLVKK